MPLIVTGVWGEAASLGVRRGWQVQKIGSQELRRMSFEEACGVLWHAVEALPESAISYLQCPAELSGVTDLLGRYGPLGASEVVSFLENFGYSLAGPDSWGPGPQPNVKLGPVLKHTATEPKLVKVDHPWFEIHGYICSDALCKDWQWTVSRRLRHIQGSLVGPVRSELGQRYNRLFKMPQASNEVENSQRRGRESTARLEAWFLALATAMRELALSPALTAAVLRFLGAPVLFQKSQISLPALRSKRTVSK